MIRLLLFLFLAAQSGNPAYLTRGDAIQARHSRYVELLQEFRASLLTRIRMEAPQLEQRLDESAAVTTYGYQVVPKLLPDPPRPETSGPITPGRYSWPRTEGLYGTE